MNIQTPGEAPSHAVIEAVAEQRGCDVRDLPPLYDSIDTDALDRLFADPAATTSRVLRFSYDGSTVELQSDGQLTVSVNP